MARRPRRPGRTVARLACVGVVAVGLLAAGMLNRFPDLERRADQAYWGVVAFWLILAMAMFLRVIVLRWWPRRGAAE